MAPCPAEPAWPEIRRGQALDLASRLDPSSAADLVTKAVQIAGYLEGPKDPPPPPAIPIDYLTRAAASAAASKFDMVIAVEARGFRVTGRSVHFRSSRFVPFEAVLQTEGRALDRAIEDLGCLLF